MLSLNWYGKTKIKKKKLIQTKNKGLIQKLNSASDLFVYNQGIKKEHGISQTFQARYQLQFWHCVK